jgi:Histidine phosphatase superfamily (branch 2)
MLEKVAQGTNVLHHETTATTQKHIAQGRGPFGKLTQMGLLQMIDVGNRLKEELEQATTWSPNANFAHRPFRQLSPSDIKIYSTDFARTIQSVQGVLVGFFPDGPSEPIDIDCRHTTSWMIPDPQPRRTKEQEALEVELATRPHILERETEMKPLAIRCTQSLLPLLGDDAFAVSYGVGEDNDTDSTAVRTLSWAQLSEITKCLQVRNLLPESITIEDQEATSAYCAWKWFESLRHPRLAYLSMHHFTHTIVHGMKEYEKEPPLIIFSCHDSSLIGLLCAFHLEQPSVWPEYGSVLKIELLEKINSEKEEEVADLVVRFYLNGELLRSMWHGRSRNEISLKKLANYISTVGAVKAS